jgi:hypothetical protein
MFGYTRDPYWGESYSYAEKNENSTLESVLLSVC